MKQCIAITNSGHRCKNTPERKGLFCSEHRLWILVVIVAVVAFLANITTVLENCGIGLGTSQCPPKVGDTFHSTVGAKIWSQPDISQGTVTKVFGEKVEIYVLDGPISGSVRSDNLSIRGNWWKISLGKGQESIGWIWEGRFDECQPR